MLARLKGGLNPGVPVCLRKKTEEVGMTGKIEEISEAGIILVKYFDHEEFGNFVTFLCVLLFFFFCSVVVSKIRRS